MAENDEKLVEERKQKIKNWLNDHYNILLLGILIFAFCIRLYFFFITKGQTLWWDEAEYMSTAKHWAFDVPYALNPQRPPLFQLLAALTFMIGLGETFVRFAWVLLPSFFLVLFIYLLGKEMFDKKIGLIAAFLSAISWTFLFWTTRIQPDSFSMCFQVLSVLFMWKYWKYEKSRSIILSGIFAAMGLYFKVSALLVPMSFILFILIKDRFSAFKNKNYYYFSLAFLATLVPYFIWAYINFGKILAFTTGYSNALGPTPFAWGVLSFFYLLSENVLFILFLLGTILALKFLLYLDVLAKDKKKCFDAKLFGVIVLFVVAAFYIFYIRSIEDRWVFLWMPFIFMFIGNALEFLYNFGKKYTKIISIIVVILLLAIGGYMQYKHTDYLVDMKLRSYQQVKDAALWVKDNSEVNDKVLSVSYPQTVYYSERNVSTYAPIQSPEEFNSYLNATKARFMIISIFEPSQPKWSYTWPNENNSVPVQAYFADAQNKQPILIIYELKYS